MERHVPKVIRQCCCGPNEDPHFDMKEIIDDIRPRYQCDGEEVDGEKNRRTSLSAVAKALKATKKATKK